MKVLFVITGLGGGGAEKVVCSLADKMYEKGHQVIIAYLTREVVDVVVKPKHSEINLICLDLNSLFDGIKSFRKYKKIIQEFSPDVVHAHMAHANIFTRLCRLFIKVPRLICTAHSSNEGGKIRMLAYRLTHKLSDVTTSVSHAASINLIKNKAVPTNDILTIYNGINLKKFSVHNIGLISLKQELNINLDGKLFIAVGRFHEAKDYPNLINAFSLYLKKAEKKFLYHLLIVGDGDPLVINEVKDLITKYGLHQNIHLLGRRDDIVELLSGADLFVLSSKYEGLPTVVIEAMACETFVIATDCGGSSEIMGDTGILVSPQNSRALAQALKEAVDKIPLEIKENNLKARQRVEELFSLEKSVQNWLSLYEQN